MSEIRKANVEGAAYFITLTVEGWVDVFTRKVLVDELVSNLKYCQEHKGLEVFAYVIMPSHVHLIVRREGGLLSDWLRDFKAFTAKRMLALVASETGESRREWMLPFFQQQAVGKAQNKHFAFWRKDSHPIELWSGKVVEQKVQYIHQNPVEQGIVAEAHHYLLSSAHIEGPLVLNGYLQQADGNKLV